MQAPSRNSSAKRQFYRHGRRWKSERKTRPKPIYTERRDRHTTSMLALHIVLTPKYRGKVLKGGVAIECERQIKWTCKTLDVKILEMAVAEDHVHLFLQFPPKLAPSKIVEKLKSNSSRKLREKYPHLINWCPKALWAPGGFHGSVGTGFEVVEKYIAGQKAYGG